MMIKKISLLLAAVMLLGICTACDRTPNNDTSSASGSTSQTDSGSTPTQSQISSETENTSSNNDTTTSGVVTTVTTTVPTNNTQKTELTVTEMRALVKESATKLGITDDMLDVSIVNEGNMTRLAAAIRKSISGGNITLGVIGGSITEGAGASDYSRCYAQNFKTWWETLFPKCTVTIINAGKGSTGSIIGVHCAPEALLKHDPDVVIMEYAANDSNTPIYTKSYESLLRRIWSCKSNPAVMLLFTMHNTGRSVQKTQVKIGEHYNVPMISYKDALYPSVEAGTIEWSQISADTVHPTDTGHSMIGVLIANYLVNVCEKLDSISAEETALPDPIAKNGDMYAEGILYTPENLTADKLGDFTVTDSEFYQFAKAWKAVGGNGELVVTIPDCKNLFILITRVDNENAGDATITVQGTEVKTTEVTQKYPGLGEFSYADPISVYQSDVASDVTVTVKLNDTNPKSFFALLGFMAS